MKPFEVTSHQEGSSLELLRDPSPSSKARQRRIGWMRRGLFLLLSGTLSACSSGPQIRQGIDRPREEAFSLFQRQTEGNPLLVGSPELREREEEQEEQDSSPSEPPQRSLNGIKAERSPVHTITVPEEDYPQKGRLPDFQILLRRRAHQEELLRNIGGPAFLALLTKESFSLSEENHQEMLKRFLDLGKRIQERTQMARQTNPDQFRKEFLRGFQILSQDESLKPTSFSTSWDCTTKLTPKGTTKTLLTP